MASLSTTTSGDGTVRYVVNYREPDGAQRRKTFRRKAEAHAFRHAVETDKFRGTYIDITAGDVTFAAYAAEWLAGRTFDEATAIAVALRLRKHVYPELGHLPLRHIKPSTIQRWLRSIDHLATTYRRVIYAHVSAVLSAAVDDDLIAKNPCKAGSVDKPSTARQKVKPWDAATVTAMRDALPPRYRLAVTLGAGLGLRQGEIFGLSPDDIDAENRSVEVRRQVKLVTANRLVFAPPKNTKTRTVPLPDAVAAAIAAHRSSFRPCHVTLPWGKLDAPKSERVPLLLTTRERKALNRNYFNGSIWRQAQAEAGVAPERSNGMHALRHWYASVLLDAGESIRAVSEFLGHSDPGFTLRTYTHLMPSSSERTRVGVDAALATTG